MAIISGMAEPTLLGSAVLRKSAALGDVAEAVSRASGNRGWLRQGTDAEGAGLEPVSQEAPG
jgi:hypothetical protein